MPRLENVGKTSEFIFTWHVENFSLLLIKKQCIYSPDFQIKPLQNTEWNLTLCLPADDEDNVTLNLSRNDSEDPSEIKINGKLFIAKINGSYIYLGKRSIGFKTFYSYVDPLIIKREEILKKFNEFVHNDTLTVGCKFYINSKDSIPTIIECSARSKLYTDKYSFLLPLNLSTHSNCEHSIFSPLISNATKHPKFKIGLECFDYSTNDSGVRVTITIHLYETNIECFSQCKLSFLNKGVIKYKCQINLPFAPGITNQSLSVNISRQVINNNAIFDSTCLKCEFIASTGDIISSLENTIYKQEMQGELIPKSFNMSPLQSSLMEMYDKKTLCDFKVIVSGKVFPCHKIVLSAVSPVFMLMFKSGLAESEKSEVTIEEYSVEAVEKMLEFSYNDRVTDLKWDLTLELYSIADKYQIQKLKAVCNSFLESAITVETMPDLLALADFHEDAYLSKVVEQFICGNLKAVFKSHAWKQCMNNHVQIASKVMYRICKLYSEIDVNPLQEDNNQILEGGLVWARVSDNL